MPSDWAQFGGSASHVGVNVESWLNIAMLMPAGLRAGAGHPADGVARPAGGAVLPVGIELTQVAIPGRECSVSDWIANALGGLAGVIVGGLTQRWLRARKAARAGTPPAGTPDTLSRTP